MNVTENMLVDFSPASIAGMRKAIDKVLEAKRRGEKVVLSVCECGCVRVHLYQATCEITGKDLPTIDFACNEPESVTGLRWFVEQLDLEASVIRVSQNGSDMIRRCLRERKQFLLVDAETTVVRAHC